MLEVGSYVGSEKLGCPVCPGIPGVPPSFEYSQVYLLYHYTRSIYIWGTRTYTSPISGSSVIKSRVYNMSVQPSGN